MNPEPICPPYILWLQRIHVGSDPSSPNPQPVVVRSQPSSLVVQPVIARPPPSSFEQHPSLHAVHPLSRTVDSSSRVATRRRALRTRRCKVRNPSSRPFPHPPRTRPRQPYKYARVFLFPRTLSEHPSLHLLRRLLAGFSTGC